MNFGRISARAITARSLRSAGASYGTSRWLSLWCWPWGKRRG